MLDTIYIGMSGLTSFSKGLSNISSNVANLNTTGFKGSDLQFLDLFYQRQLSSGYSSAGNGHYQGSGVKAGESSVKFTQGDFRQTGNDLDAAITGNGFFVVKKDNKTFFTRAGQFEVNDAGNLVTRDDGSLVQGYAGGSLQNINISGNRSVPATATTQVRLADTLSINDATFDLNNVTLIDSLGKEHATTISFVNNNATVSGQWSFTVKEGTTTLATGTISYSGSGVPVPGQERFTFAFSPAGANANQVTLDFSNTNSLSASSSTIKLSSQNGVKAGFLTKTALNTEGYLVLSYSNGQTNQFQQLALANVDNLSSLKPEGGNRFSQSGKATLVMSTAGKLGLGTLQVSGVELSNVDLAREFSELIVVQRGYQASSQVISAANEMIQQLGEIRGRK